jgi:Haem-dependent oxidative N-demethylase, alpha subunit-like
MSFSADSPCPWCYGGAMTSILQHSLPYDAGAVRALPGIQPLDIADWLVVDEAYAAQMAERARLLSQHRDAVLAMHDSARPAARELLDLVLSLAYPDADGISATRPDGVLVGIDRADPLATLGMLVQEDFCILQKSGEEHVLTGAVLCFPASWTLSEKFMAPLIGIHRTVGEYDESIARRVQRLFDGVQPGRPLWRFNALSYGDAKLYQPRSIHDPPILHSPETDRYMRSERQCILRLPRTQAVVFSIHTYVLERRDAPTTG